jgi:methylglyoxal synthase
MMKISIIAHDHKKAEMVGFAMKNKEFFQSVEITSTGTTGLHLESAGLKVNKKESGPKGGDAQIASMIVDSQIDLVFFFIDPLTSHAHEVDVQMLLRLCNVYNVPIATNPATAELMIRAISHTA